MNTVLDCKTLLWTKCYFLFCFMKFALLLNGYHSIFSFFYLSGNVTRHCWGPKKKETRSSGVCCEGLFSKWVVMTEPAVPTQPTFILRRNQHQMEGHRSTGSKNTVPNKVNSEKIKKYWFTRGKCLKKSKYKENDEVNKDRGRFANQPPTGEPIETIW